MPMLINFLMQALDKMDVLIAAAEAVVMIEADAMIAVVQVAVVVMIAEVQDVVATIFLRAAT
jgi:hypothetical protein